MFDLVESWILANPLQTVGVLCGLAIAIGYLTLLRTSHRKVTITEHHWTPSDHPRC